MPKVSVVIPVYNTGQYLRQCLDGVISQTFQDIEIICVDDGSTDDSAGILGEYALKDERIRVIEQEHQGVSIARNTGLDLALGEYIQFLDSDDFFEPTMIEELYARCVQHDADIGVCKIRYAYVDTGKLVEASWSLRIDRFPDSLPFNRGDMTENLLLSMTPIIWNKMLRRSFVIAEELRFSPDLRSAEDVPFTYLALLKAQRITAIDKVLVNYRTGTATSLQATVHERPTEICKALAAVKNRVAEEGFFPEVERDFVNAAIDHCLYTLETVKTSDAFHELYEALSSTYLVELGIDGRTKDYFSDARYYEGYLMLRDLSPEAYLFDQARDLRSQRDHSRDQLSEKSAALHETSAALHETSGVLHETSESLHETRSVLHETSESLHETRSALDDMRIKYEHMSAEASHSAAEVVSLGEQMDEIRNLLFSEARSLRGQLDETRVAVKQTTAKLNKTSAKLKKIRASRSYKAGRAVTAIPRKINKLFRSFRKAK